MKQILFVLTSTLLISTAINGQNLFFIGENSYRCTESITLQANTNEFYINDLNVLFATDGEKELFVVSSETNNVLFHGKLIIYLDDGTVITLTDKGIYDYVDNIAYAVYYLNYEEVSKMKKSNINTVRYRLEGESELSTRAFGGNFSASNKGINTKKLVSDFFSEKYVLAKPNEEPKEISQKNTKEQEEKKRKLNELMVGDKGYPDGDPYANSYYGDPGTGSGGVGYGLKGRGAPTKTIYKQDCNESGLVVVRIEVNRNGSVIKAEPGVRGTTNNASCLLETAKKIAITHKWRPDSKAPTRQIGFVSVNFKLGQ